MCCNVLYYVQSKECASLQFKYVSAMTLTHFQSMCGCFSSLSVSDGICTSFARVTNKAITFLFTRDRRSLTFVFSMRHSWVVFDEKQARYCDPQVNFYEIGLLF